MGSVGTPTTSSTSSTIFCGDRLRIWGSVGQVDRATNLFLPDTVLFKGDQPITWYFTSDGRIKTKQRTKLNVDEIKNHFIKHVGESGIVATFMRPGENDEDPEIICEHFDRSSFGIRGITRPVLQKKGRHKERGSSEIRASER